VTAGDAHDARARVLDSTRSWLLVALGVCVLTVVWGAIFTFTVYASELAAAFDLTGLQASSVFSITTAVFLVAGGAFGVLAARVPLRPVVAASGVGLAVVAVALHAVDSYVGLVVVFALLGMAGGTAFVVVVSLVPQWFDTYQGRAMGITMTGNGLGVLCFPFVWLQLFERVSFRTAFGVVVGTAALVVLAASAVYRRPPGGTRDAPTVDVAWLRERLGHRPFLAVVVGYGVLWGWYYVLSAHLVDILTGNGIRLGVAATAFSVVGGVSILARVGSGAVGDRFDPRAVFSAAVVLAAAAVVALPAIGSRLPLYVVLVGCGIGNGTLAALWSPIILSRFGAENATATVGILNFAIAAVAFLAPLAVSALRVRTGDYALPLVALGILTVVGVALFHWGTAPEHTRAT